MSRWIVLAVLGILVLLVCVLRLGVAAGYDQSGGWLKLRLGPKWFALYPRPAPKRSKPKKTQKEVENTDKKEKFPMGGSLELALDLLPAVKTAAGRFRRALRIDELSLYLVWGEPDPADAAIHYGRAWGVAEALLAFLRANFEVKKHQVQMDLDYQLEKPRLTVRAALSLTAAQLLRIVLPLIWTAFMTLWNQRKQRTAAVSAAKERKEEDDNGKEPSCQ